MKLIKSQRIKADKYPGIGKLVAIHTIFFFIAAILVISPPVQAREIESTEEIRLAAKKFLAEKQDSADKTNTEITIGQIDPRLRLAKCSHELEIFLPQSSRTTGKTNVGIRCRAPIGWKIFVSANIVEYQEVWVLNRNITSGEIIGRNDIVKQQVAVTNRRKAPLTDLQQLLNASPKRFMRDGAVIYQDSVCLVCRGDQVTVSAKNEFLSIDVAGIALNDAVLGERIQVRNLQSKKVFGATVTGKNQLIVKIAGSN